MAGRFLPLRPNRQSYADGCSTRTGTSAPSTLWARPSSPFSTHPTSLSETSTSQARPPSLRDRAALDLALAAPICWGHPPGPFPPVHTAAAEPQSIACAVDPSELPAPQVSARADGHGPHGIAYQLDAHQQYQQYQQYPAPAGGGCRIYTRCPHAHGAQPQYGVHPPTCYGVPLMGFEAYQQYQQYPAPAGGGCQPYAYDAGYRPPLPASFTHTRAHILARANTHARRPGISLRNAPNCRSQNTMH